MLTNRVSDRGPVRLRLIAPRRHFQAFSSGAAANNKSRKWLGTIGEGRESVDRRQDLYSPSWLVVCPPKVADRRASVIYFAAPVFISFARPRCCSSRSAAISLQDICELRAPCVASYVSVFLIALLSVALYNRPRCGLSLFMAFYVLLYCTTATAITYRSSQSLLL